MTRPKDQAAAEKEAWLQEAITAVKSKQHTCCSAAKGFNIPPRTLYDRVNGGKKPRNQAHERDQNLIHAEEKELVRWITLLTISGYPPRYKLLRQLAEIIRERRVKKLDSNQVQVTVYDKIRDQWVLHFLRRHRELANVHSRSIDAVRVKDTSSEWLKWWFDDLEKIWAKFNIKSENAYNMDENEFAIDEKETRRYIININLHQIFQAKPGYQKWISVMKCIYIDESVVSSLVIFKMEKLSI